MSETIPPALKHQVVSTLQLPPGPWKTVLDCLCAHFKHIEREQWLSRMARGRVLDAQDQALTPTSAYRVGITVRYFREVANEVVIPFAERIVYADADIVVADKPHFLPVTPKGIYVQETLLARLIKRLDNPQLAPLHRIDRGTAGLVMFSANAANRARYHVLFRNHQITKEYEAIALPLPMLDFPLVRRSRLMAGEPFFRMQEVSGSANTETRIDVIERGAMHWRYKLSPVTGKKHQLRVHMAALGAGIVNDDFYPELAQRDDDFTQPLKLLAASLAFDDPVSGERRQFKTGFSL
jgi:tRNA pseudouridine32 synthase/23S rRNA pseudouridine746 synthase